MFTAQGTEAEVHVGDVVALRLSDWTLTHDPPVLGSRDSRVTGHVAYRNEFWATQPYTDIRLRMGDVFWCWPSPVITITHDQRAFVRITGDPLIRG